MDSLERNAISSAVVAGSLPQRTLYLELIYRGYCPGIDFDFSSERRNELGGAKADFLLEFKNTAIRISPDEDGGEKDFLTLQGLETLDVDKETILDPELLGQWMDTNLEVS